MWKLRFIKTFVSVSFLVVVFISCSNADKHDWNGWTLHLNSMCADQVLMLLMDSQHRRVGFEKMPPINPTVGMEISGYEEIPQYSYGALQMPEPAHGETAKLGQTAGITRIVEGQYTLQLSGVRKGHFNITVNAWSYDGKQLLKRVSLEGAIDKDEIIRYKIECQSTPVATFIISKLNP